MVLIGGLRLTFVMEPVGATTRILREPPDGGSRGIGVGAKFVKFWQFRVVIELGVVGTRTLVTNGVVEVGGAVRVDGEDTVGAG